MNEFSVWMPLIVSLVGSGALLLVNIYTVRNNGRREVSLRQGQQRHDELMVRSEQAHAERSRLVDQRHAAYRELLDQIRSTAEDHHRMSASNPDPVYPTKFWAAASQAKLVSKAETRVAIDAVLHSFYLSHFQRVAEAEQALVEVLADELR